MSIFGSILKTVVAVATSPIDLAMDVVTLGGALTEQGETYILRKLQKIVDDIEDISEDIGDL